MKHNHLIYGCLILSTKLTTVDFYQIFRIMPFYSSHMSSPVNLTDKHAMPTSY